MAGPVARMAEPLISLQEMGEGDLVVDEEVEEEEEVVGLGVGAGEEVEEGLHSGFYDITAEDVEVQMDEVEEGEGWVEGESSFESEEISVSYQVRVRELDFWIGFVIKKYLLMKKSCR